MVEDGEDLIRDRELQQHMKGHIVGGMRVGAHGVELLLCEGEIFEYVEVHEQQVVVGAVHNDPVGAAQLGVRVVDLAQRAQQFFARGREVICRSEALLFVDGRRVGGRHAPTQLVWRRVVVCVDIRGEGDGETDHDGGEEQTRANAQF